MLHFTRLAEGLEIEPLLAEMDEEPDMWFADTSRQRKVRCQRNTLNIFLRAPKKPLPPGAKNANDVHESRLTRAATRFPRALAFCEMIADEWGATLGRATLVALLPRSRVYPHIDTGAYYRIRDRLHLVLRSPGGSPLTAADETDLSVLPLSSTAAKITSDGDMLQANSSLTFSLLAKCVTQ